MATSKVKDDLARQQAYEYAPLPTAASFRLLEIEPARHPDAPLECSLQVHPLPRPALRRLGVHDSQLASAAFPSWVPRWDVEWRPGTRVLCTMASQEFAAAGETRHSPGLASPQNVDHLVVEGLVFSRVREASSDFEAAGLPDPAEPRAVAATPRGFQPYWGSKAFNAVSYGRRRFATQNGCFGLGPAGVRTGRLVCVLFGGRVPYMLRLTDTEGFVRLVGESYVHGIMHGEAIRLWRERKLSKVRFTLCRKRRNVPAQVSEAENSVRHAKACVAF
ncbi:hypothetical protein GGR56DRAFT_554404 [Xylariaceae sp. FL0804]|nr:hypothetical protein GGR56DRAFT_554404 [Xylariaceae sp. FL0804]